jgi:uncharacterized protein (TIGR02147 family)
MDRIPSAERDISGVYFSFRKSQMAAVKQLIHHFRQEILELASQEADADSVYQLNLQLFPIANLGVGEKS